MSSKGEDGATAKGLLKELKKERFLKLLHYMIDVMAVLEVFQGSSKMKTCSLQT